MLGLRKGLAPCGIHVDSWIGGPIDLVHQAIQLNYAWDS